MSVSKASPQDLGPNGMSHGKESLTSPTALCSLSLWLWKGCEIVPFEIKCLVLYVIVLVRQKE
jgi:hypothetical protein